MKNIRFVLAILFLGSLAVSLTTCAGSRKLNGIVISPTNPTWGVGTTQQFSAIGYYNDQTNQDITTQVTWTSSDPEVATINGSGLATTIAPGTTTITATSSIANSFSTGPTTGTTTLTVIAAPIYSISVTPPNPSIPVGITRQFTATGVFADGSSYDITTKVTWSSSNTSVAIIDSNGLATGVSASISPVTITATFGTVSGSTTLTVNSAILSSVSVSPIKASIPVGITPQFKASGIYSDGTSFDITMQVLWSSSNTSAVTVDSNGLATAIAPGTATIKATSGTISGSATLTVTSATLSSISVTPASPGIPVGFTQQLAASGAYSGGTSFDITTQVAWSSANISVATVNNTGMATAVAAGTATITGTLGTISGSATLTVTSATLISISVTPANPSIPAGVTQQFAASGTYADGTSFDLTTQVSWNSSANVVATVNSSGLATAVAAGTATITATFGAISGTTTLTVTSATLASISVTPANPSIPVGATQQFRAFGIYSDGTSFDITGQFSWSSSNTLVATVNNSGLATALAAGTATITAFSLGMPGGSTVLTVQ